MVNLKNAYWKRVSDSAASQAEVARFQHHWTTARDGMANWPSLADELKKRSYKGLICLTAEYADEKAVDRLVAEDIKYARSLFA
jgi:sugar phosphate isomerase/epimerase